MTSALDTTPSTIDRIRHDLVGLKMPRALEALDHVVRRLEKGEIAAAHWLEIKPLDPTEQVECNRKSLLPLQLSCHPVQTP